MALPSIHSSCFHSCRHCKNGEARLDHVTSTRYRCPGRCDREKRSATVNIGGAKSMLREARALGTNRRP